MNRIVECVPNFSEGRRPEVIRRIVEAMQAVPGVQILNVMPDADHNRTDVTMIGTPEAVEEAAFAGIACAAQLINMDEHRGEHPRIGATDVVPFVPVQSITMEDCVQLAQRLGRRVGDELRIPVYLYEAAATRPDRVNLADIRRGEYEALKSEIEMNPARLPDFGPARVGTAGATVIGARPFLIAFNVYLNTSDVEIAKQIARTVRYSSGGLPFVKARGFLVGGYSLETMNLTDFTHTPIYQVLELIRRETTKHGVSITRSELAGLIPLKALLDVANWYLQRDKSKSSADSYTQQALLNIATNYLQLELDPNQVLENRL